MEGFTNIVGRAGLVRPYDPNELRHEPEVFSVEQWEQAIRDDAGQDRRDRAFATERLAAEFDH